MPRTKASSVRIQTQPHLAKAPADYFPASERAFIEWARGSLQRLNTVQAGAAFDDLEPIGRMIGNARVVALSEALHCAAEPLEFRNRLFEYLVRKLGFTAIAIESGVTESRIVHDYVHGGAGELTDALAQGISWTFDQLPQNAALIEWMRRYNAEARGARKINFYGFDVPGSPANSDARRSVDTALTESLRYLHRVDTYAAQVFQTRLAPLLGKVRFDLDGTSSSEGYDTLSQDERDKLTATIADLITLIERSEAKYTAASSPADFAWGQRAAVAARQVDAWLRQIPPRWKRTASPGEILGSEAGFLCVANDVRDRAQASNLEWIIDREGPQGKVLVFAARFHLSCAPVKSTYWMSQGIEHEQHVAGTYLRRRFSDGLVTIGNVFGTGRTDYRPTPLMTAQQSIDGLAREVGAPLYMLDLRAAPPQLAKWLQQEHSLSDGMHELRCSPGKAFDMLLYFDDISPASTRAAIM